MDLFQSVNVGLHALSVHGNLKVKSPWSFHRDLVLWLGVSATCPEQEDSFTYVVFRRIKGVPNSGMKPCVTENYI